MSKYRRGLLVELLLYVSCCREVEASCYNSLGTVYILISEVLAFYQTRFAKIAMKVGELEWKVIKS